MMHPKYAHDCLHCLFTGQYNFDGMEVDGWYCWRSVLGGSVILRYGNEPAAYSSLPASLVNNDDPDMLVYRQVLSAAAAIRTGILTRKPGRA